MINESRAEHKGPIHILYYSNEFYYYVLKDKLNYAEFDEKKRCIYCFYGV